MSSEIISNGNFPPQGDNMMKADYRLTADQMDDKRKQNIAYEYLCHLEEAKVWIQACINEELPPTTELEEGLRNGVFLAQLGHFLSPQTVPLKKIYDRDQTRYQGRGLHFRHTDNINHWFSAMDKIGLPKIFYPETTDIYDRKNMPRVIYCLHALSLYCFKLGMAPQIQDLYGKVQFTDEEISAMRLELEKYGIQMPAFGKIGGILANELSVDDAALHAAIIAINEAVDRDNATETMAALQNPSAMLVNLDHEAEEQYQTLLYDAKQTKAEIAKNKSMDLDGTYEYDVYDELLTQAEIQGNINKVNVARALDKLCAGLLENDVETVMQILRSPALSLKGIQEDNRNLYMKALQETYRNKLQSTDEDDCILDRDEIQNAINEANLEADAEYQKLLCVKSINSAVDSDDPAALLQALQNPKAQLPSVHQYGLMLYFEEFTSMKREKEADLDYDEIYTALNVMSAVVGINQAVEVGNSECTFMALSTENAFITNLDEDNMDRYQKQLFLSLSEKSQAQCKLLTHYEISSIVDQVNEQVDVEHKRIEALRNINEAIRQGDPQLTLDTLKHPDALLENVCEDQAYRYHILLNRAIQKKEEEYKDEDATLWVNEIQELVDRANQDAQDGVALSSAVIAANEKIEEGNDQNLFECLSSNDLGLHSVIQDCAQMYVTKLQEFKSEKSSKGDVGSGWIMNRLPDNSKFFYNVYNSSYVWARTENMVKDSQYLTRDEIQSTVAEVTASHDRELMFQSNERFVIRIQSCVRGYLVWKAFKERLSFMQEQLPAIVKIQATWKGFKQRSKYNDRLDFLSKHTDVATKLQSVIRMWLVNKEYRKRLKYFREHEDSVIKIQAFVRSNKAKHDYNALMHEENPPLSVVQRFVHLLDASDVDYAEEIELQKLRQQVVTEIKSTKDLERDLDTMDIKIGLLIKNRISIHDVVTHDKKLSKHKEISFHQPKGLKALSKEAHDRLEAYQYLFYLLQTNPTYLAKLIFEMPQMRTTKFMESVIYSLFNYGSNQREEYLLLRLFQTALEEEVGSKVEKMSDFITGNPLVVKMIVGYNRNQRGQNSLREMLNPVVLEVIEDKNIRINTNPVDIYKAWINQTETTTGKTSTLPYDVSVEQALEHNEVQQQLKKSIAVLQEVTDKFLTAILNSLDKIPYCMRYMAKVLKNVLVKKFPGALEKDILKIVGNVLYYRYINSAIVAPDCFDIINVEADKPLTNDQRLNLGSVAKILQCAASSRGFGGESNYLASMNPYIREAHEKFKNYCLQACDVPEPEEKFNMDQYTDVVTMTKPVIYISVSEICDTHELLLDHQDQIAPEPNDPLHELLEDLGDVPSVDELLGVDLPEDPQLHDHFLSQLGTTEITLTLNNKFEVPEDEQTDIQQLLIKTKRLVVDVIACQPGENLTQILETPATEEQEEMHQTLVKKRDIRDRKMVKGHGTKLVRNQSLLGDNRLPIESIKAKIKKNMQNLELSEIVSRKNKYQDIVNMIAQDIRNQRKYRNSRKQDLLKTKSILKSLAAKRSFYESQIDYYSRYVKTCMENLQNTKANNRRSKGLFKKTDKKLESVKYSGAKLHDKGIILDVEGLPPNQLKNVMFEISETNDPGVFDVNARFMGVEMDKVELVFETLLQLQYEGVAVMEMFGKAKINVNLLIFLLNKKFYGRHGK